MTRQTDEATAGDDDDTPRALVKGGLVAALTGLVVVLGAASARQSDPFAATFSFGADPHYSGTFPGAAPAPLRNRALLAHDLGSVNLSAYDIQSVAEMDRVFRTVAFDLSEVRRDKLSVPRVFLESLPSDFGKTMPVAVRKTHFIRIVLPMILAANEEIQADRKRLMDLDGALETGGELSVSEILWLRQLARRYEVGVENLPLVADATVDHQEDLRKGLRHGIETLLTRVDSVSVSLALAQAIEETGWGRSRFARDGNALFGQRIWRKGGGIVPTKRASDETFEVRSFDSLLDGVRQYALNINTHPAYRNYRAMRRDYRKARLPLDGLALSTALKLYSERGEAYIANLKKIIRNNDLRQLEQAVLQTSRDEA